jgi:hypothetical protein
VHCIGGFLFTSTRRFSIFGGLTRILPRARFVERISTRSTSEVRLHHRGESKRENARINPRVFFVFHLISDRRATLVRDDEISTSSPDCVTSFALKTLPVLGLSILKRLHFSELVFDIGNDMASPQFQDFFHVFSSTNDISTEWFALPDSVLRSLTENSELAQIVIEPRMSPTKTS